MRLIDSAHDARVTVVPSMGNRGIEFSVHGKNVIFVPDNPKVGGIPFLAPWANRLNEAGFWADDRHYVLNPSLKNYQTDNNGLPMHGLLFDSNRWQVVEAKADQNSAFVTSRLTFWTSPELMEQWPFAHVYEMTYRLSNGELEVRTSIHNLSDQPMPVSVGFHPYYRLPGIPRDQWTLQMPRVKAVVTDKQLIPTGEFKVSDLPDPLPMKGHILDNGFTDLARDAEGRAHFHLASGSEAIDITFGPKYQVAVIWEPPGRAGADPQFICVEPMAAVTNGLNLAHEGKYPSLESIAPGQTWTESFWVKPAGI